MTDVYAHGMTVRVTYANDASIAGMLTEVTVPGAVEGTRWLGIQIDPLRMRPIPVARPNGRKFIVNSDIEILDYPTPEDPSLLGEVWWGDDLYGERRLWVRVPNGWRGVSGPAPFPLAQWGEIGRKVPASDSDRRIV